MDVNQIVNRLKQQAQTQNSSQSPSQIPYSESGNYPRTDYLQQEGFQLGQDGLLATPDGRNVKMSDSFLS